MELKVIVTCICFAVLVGCSTKADAPSELSETDAKQRAVSFVPGVAGGVERIETADEHRWAVTVTMTGGAEAVVELERADGHLAEISAEKGPFEYDFAAPGAGIATYAKARSVALATKQGQVEAWEINLLKNVWEFYVRTADNQLWEIKLNAQTAAVISTEEKAQRD